MKSKKLLAAAVAAITMLAGGLGIALWPSPADAGYPVRKFSGAIQTNAPTTLHVDLHNPHPTATLKWEVVTRSPNGVEQSRSTATVGPNGIVRTNPLCDFRCSLEVNTNSPILQPSVFFFSSLSNSWQYVYAGDFSR